MPKPQTYPIIVRRSKKTDAIELFMYDGGKYLTCFSWSEGHGNASYKYFLNDTYPASEEDSQAHFKRYCETPGEFNEVVPVLRKRFSSIRWTEGRV